MSVRRLEPFEGDDQVEPEPEPVEAPAEGSVLDVIRRRRESYHAEEHYYALVPGYEGLFALECGPLKAETQTATRVRMQMLERKGDPARDWAINADTLIAVTERVVGRVSIGSPWESIDTLTGEPVRIEERLAELLGVEAASARELLRAVFDKVPSPEVAIGVRVNEYLEWAQGLDLDADRLMMGES